jgi:geranylgeranyl diphosphate synthase type II
LLLKALELSSVEQKEVILNWIGKTDFEVNEKVMAITTIYNELGIREITEDSIERFYQSALRIFGEIELPAETKAGLLQLANLIMNRDH